MKTWLTKLLMSSYQFRALYCVFGSCICVAIIHNISVTRNIWFPQAHKCRLSVCCLYNKVSFSVSLKSTYAALYTIMTSLYRTLFSPSIIRLLWLWMKLLCKYLHTHTTRLIRYSVYNVENKRWWLLLLWNSFDCNRKECQVKFHIFQHAASVSLQNRRENSSQTITSV